MLYFTLLLVVDAVFAGVDLPQQCRTEQSGRPPAPSYVVPEKQSFDLGPGVALFKYNFKPPCFHGVLELTACDVVTPRVYVSSTYRVEVERKSDLSQHALVTAKYYCPLPLVRRTVRQGDQDSGNPLNEDLIHDSDDQVDVGQREDISYDEQVSTHTDDQVVPYVDEQVSPYSDDLVSPYIDDQISPYSDDPVSPYQEEDLPYVLVDEQ